MMLSWHEARHVRSSFCHFTEIHSLYCHSFLDTQLVLSYLHTWHSSSTVCTPWQACDLPLHHSVCPVQNIHTNQLREWRNQYSEEEVEQLMAARLESLCLCVRIYKFCYICTYLLNFACFYSRVHLSVCLCTHYVSITFPTHCLFVLARLFGFQCSCRLLFCHVFVCECHVERILWPK